MDGDEVYDHLLLVYPFVLLMISRNETAFRLMSACVCLLSRPHLSRGTDDTIYKEAEDL